MNEFYYSEIFQNIIAFNLYKHLKCIGLNGNA